MTVSKALRDAPDIAAKTKLRIGDLAKRMGYTPNLGARSLRSQETKLLGLVIPATTDPIFARIVMAIEQRALEHGYELILHHSWNQPEQSPRRSEFRNTPFGYGPLSRRTCGLGGRERR